MKLLHINATALSGSTGTIIKSINALLKERCENTEIRVASRDGKNDSTVFRYINSLEYFIVRVFRKLFGKTNFGTYLPTKRLIHYIENFRPDIIHIHVIHHQSLNYKLLFKFLNTYKGKVFYTLHDCWPFTGGCYHYSEFGCDKFLNGCNGCGNAKCELDCLPSATSKEFAIKKQLLLNIPDITFAAVSDWLAGEAKRSFLKEKEILTVHNGINAEIFKPLDIPRDNSFTAISVATYWDKRKHLDILLSISKLNPDVTFLVVGQVPEQINPAEYPNVKLLGLTASPNALCELYNKADVFLNFSTEETFGLVTAEAMACGLPVIAFNKTACGEIVTENCGFVVDNIEEFKTALSAIKNSCYGKYKEACRETIQNNYTKEIMARNYVSLYFKKQHLEMKEIKK